VGITLGSTAPIVAQSSVARVRSSTLSLGSQGAEVVELQSILQLLGFYLGRVDGVFSESTQQGVQRFQQAAGLPITGQMTLGEWNRLLPSAGGQPSSPVINPSVINPSVNPVTNPSVNPTANAAEGRTPGATPPPTAASFPIPEAASQPPSGSVSPPSPVPESSASEAALEADDATGSANANADSVAFPLLRRNSRGRAVEQLQDRLSALGFYAGTIDGIFGEETEVAVQDFQMEFGLEPDGVVGSATWQALFNTP